MATSIKMFASIFKGTTTTALKNTIKNSNARISKGLNANAEQTEINRIQAAANELERRGAYLDAAHVNQVKRSKNEKENTSNISMIVGVSLIVLGVVFYWVKNR